MVDATHRRAARGWLQIVPDGARCAAATQDVPLWQQTQIQTLLRSNEKKIKRANR
jgi:hypothetical protein